MQLLMVEEMLMDRQPPTRFYMFFFYRNTNDDIFQNFELKNEVRMICTYFYSIYIYFYIFHYFISNLKRFLKDFIIETIESEFFDQLHKPNILISII